ncbi:recombinase family protein [Bradyrhizobium ganzhouense]|uniref:recombinase family protein n=1 Tax=Bradyrhizobium ganzhouense TaxID=1179767 RepID=UPI003CF76BCF
MAAIQEFARTRGGRIIREYSAVESGKTNERLQLAAALHHAKVTGATLVIAKLDRLSRSASFTLTLRDSGVKFVCCDMPKANDPPSVCWRWFSGRSASHLQAHHGRIEGSPQAHCGDWPEGTPQDQAAR